MSDLSWLNPTPHAICVRFVTAVASGHATLATKRALPLTWAGLPPAGSHQLAWRTHSITSSARASSVGGTSMPSVLAVLRLMTSSNLIGAWTGSSLGFAPLRMRSAYDAARRYSSTPLGPYEIKPPNSAKKRDQ